MSKKEERKETLICRGRKYSNNYYQELEERKKRLRFVFESKPHVTSF